MMEKLTEKERKFALEQLAAGVGPMPLARQLNEGKPKSRQISRQYLQKLKAKLRDPAPAAFDIAATKERIRQKSFTAIEAGVDDNSDNYKRGNLGAVFLKGVGDLHGDTVNVSVQTLIASIPEEWRSEMIITPGIELSEAREVGDGLIRTPGV